MHAHTQCRLRATNQHKLCLASVDFHAQPKPSPGADINPNPTGAASLAHWPFSDCLLVLRLWPLRPLAMGSVPAAPAATTAVRAPQGKKTKAMASHPSTPAPAAKRPRRGAWEWRADKGKWELLPLSAAATTITTTATSTPRVVLAPLAGRGQGEEGGIIPSGNDAQQQSAGVDGAAAAGLPLRLPASAKWHRRQQAAGAAAAAPRHRRCRHRRPLHRPAPPVAPLVAGRGATPPVSSAVPVPPPPPAPAPAPVPPPAKLKWRYGKAAVVAGGGCEGEEMKGEAVEEAAAAG